MEESPCSTLAVVTLAMLNANDTIDVTSHGYEFLTNVERNVLVRQM